MKKGYVNGSDILFFVGEKAVGSSTSNSLEFNSETKTRKVKAVATTPVGSSLWENKGVVGLSVSGSADGLINYDEKEASIAALLAAWKQGQPITLKASERKDTTGATSVAPFCSGSFVITKLSISAPAGDDATFQISFENDGEVDIDTSKFTITEDN